MIIKIAGKDVGIKFNNFAIEQLGKIKGSESSYYAYIATLVWCGYLGYCFVKQIEQELDFEAVSDWVDSSVNDESILPEIQKVSEAYAESQIFKRMQKKSLEEKGEGESLT